jgi:hypothetical protein
MFEELDDPQAEAITPPREPVLARVTRIRRRRVAFAGAGVAIVMVAALSTTAVLARDGDEPGDSIAATESGDASSTTRPRRATTGTTEPVTDGITGSTTVAPVAPGTTVRPPATGTTVPDDPTKRRDWSHVRFQAPRAFSIETGDTLSFDYTMVNDGSWTVAIDNGCPWFTHNGARVTCAPAAPALLAPGASTRGTVTFYAREYALPPYAVPGAGDPWNPVVPTTIYVHGLLRDQYVLGPNGSNARATVGLAVFAKPPRLTVIADPAPVTVPVDGVATATVTMRNDTGERVWDWGCHRLVAPLGVLDPPPEVPTEPTGGGSTGYVCVDRGWREPGWAATYTTTLDVSGLGPGTYQVAWGSSPEVPLYTLTVTP